MDWTKDNPDAGYRCVTCDKYNAFELWHYAHWDEEIIHSCTCGTNNYIKDGKVVHHVVLETWPILPVLVGTRCDEPCFDTPLCRLWFEVKDEYTNMDRYRAMNKLMRDEECPLFKE